MSRVSLEKMKDIFMIMIMVKIINELHDIFHLQKGQITF